MYRTSDRFDVERPVDDRALSPVIGVVLLVAIAVILSSVGAYFFFGLTENTEPAPEVALEFEATDRPLEHRLIHESGQQLDGERIEIRGVASADAITDSRFAAGERVSLYPTRETVRIVWFNDHGESFVLDEFEAEATAPEPDVACPWVDTRTSGGTSSITVPSGTVVNCDIVTDGDIDVESGAVVLGTTDSRLNNVDIDGGEVYGPVTARSNVDLDNDASIYGSVTARDDVNSANSLIGGSIETTTSGGDIDLDGDTVQGDIDAAGGADVDVDSGADVEGAVASDGGDIDIGSATISGHVYGTLNGCSGATIQGQSCSSYTSKSYSEWSG